MYFKVFGWFTDLQEPFRLLCRTNRNGSFISNLFNKGHICHFSFSHQNHPLPLPLYCHRYKGNGQHHHQVLLELCTVFGSPQLNMTIFMIRSLPSLMRMMLECKFWNTKPLLQFYDHPFPLMFKFVIIIAMKGEWEACEKSPGSLLDHDRPKKS